MKKRYLALAACALALALTACGAQMAQARPAPLTAAEQKLVDLVSAGGKTKLFDIVLPEDASWLDVTQWTLTDGAWRGETAMGGVSGGRLCLRVNDTGTLVYASVGSATSRVETEPAAKLAEGHACTETWLTEPAALALDTETPLYLYVESADGTVEVFAPSAYETPEKLAGYARVTAVTVRPTA